MKMSRGNTRLFLFLKVFIILVAVSLFGTDAQGQSDVYWEFETQGRLLKVHTADLNLDGIDEVILMDDSQTLTMLGADGQFVWGQELPGLQVLDMVDVNTQFEKAAAPGLILATPGRLQWVNPNGELTNEYQLSSAPLQIDRFEGTSSDSILVATRSGILERINGESGQRLWRYESDVPINVRGSEAIFTILPQIGNAPGSADILFSFRTADGVGRLILLNSSGEVIWQRATSVHQSAMTGLPFAVDGEYFVAIGSIDGRLALLNRQTGEEVWFRTPNRQITSLQPAVVDRQPVLLLGTDAGTAVAYTLMGQRLWDRVMGASPDQGIVEIEVTDSADDLSQNSVVMIELEPLQTGARAGVAEIVVPGPDGRPISRFTGVSELAGGELTDLNQDGYTELLLTSFSTVSLQDSGFGGEATGFVTNWSWRLDAAPSAMHAVVGPSGQTQALMVAGEDGRLHNVSPQVGLPVWQQSVDGTIEFLETVYQTGDNQDDAPDLLIGWNRIPVSSGEGEPLSPSAGLDLKRLDGTSVWEIPVQIGSLISVMAVDNQLNNSVAAAQLRNTSRSAQVYIGSTDGDVIAFSHQGEVLWQRNLGSRVLDMAIINRYEANDILAVSTSTGNLFLLSTTSGGTIRQTSRYDRIDRIIYLPPVGLNSGAEVIDSDVGLLVYNRENRLLGLDLNLNQVAGWELNYSTRPVSIDRLENSLLLKWNDGRVIRLSLGSVTPLRRIWTLNGQVNPTASIWGDVDADGRDELATSDETGKISLFTADGRPSESIELPSAVFDLDFLAQAESSSLVALTENGVVTSLSARPNRPPFLANAQAGPTGEQYTISVSTNDIDGDVVSVLLQIWDESEEAWISMGERQAPASVNRLVWTFDLPEPNTPVRYRFIFDDDTFNGSVEPAAGPQIVGEQFPFSYLVIGVLGLSLITLFIVVRQLIRTIPFRSRMRYNELVAEPKLTLSALNEIYRRSAGSPDLLLYMAGRARQQDKTALADLCDGLYLLPDRPGTAIEILAQGLNSEQAEGWTDVELWQELFEVSNELYAAPSIVELGLFSDRLNDFLPHLQGIEVEGESFLALAGPMDPLESVGRLEMARDRIAFLQEGLVLLQQEENVMMWRPHSISNQLAIAINGRWQALINATIEELRGRPWLIPSLKTRRLIAAGESVVALELHNNGQAGAEQVVVRLEEDPAYSIFNAEQSIPFLAVGRTTMLEFKITPHEPADLRLAFEIEFQDAAHRQHGFDFADMATMVSHDTPFSPIRNPYAPGTPLRRQSPLFYGRREILEFIIETIQSTSQSNVIVLVGQRRTGKTSTLLHLADVAPPDILPVYVDCQSLGVSTGMTGFLYDLAWFISDALIERELELDVPDLLVWEKDPAHYFQRRFLPRVYELLPYNATLLLVFDEFEAFEEMIGNGTLPQTFFSFLRHLMQHGGRLNFVFAGTHRLEEMGTDYWSVLFNIALYRQIDYLDKSSANKLITQPVEGKVIYDDLAMDKIWRVTAGHPYFLQLVCYTLINYANRHKTSYITIADVNEMLREMLRLGEVHFAYLWQFSTFAERAVLIAMAHLHEGDEPVTAADLQQSLRPFDLDLLPGDITGALRRLVSREILSEYRDRRLSFYDMRVGLVKLWVEENRNLSSLFERKPV